MKEESAEHFTLFSAKYCPKTWQELNSMKTDDICYLRGVNRSADRRIWPLKAHGLWISAINPADSQI